jgi:hypothetical protein
MGYTSTSKNSCAIIGINTIEGMGMFVANGKNDYHRSWDLLT